MANNILEDTPTTDWWLCDSAITNAILELERWPRWLRRVYIATFPISIPVHLILVVTAACGVLITIPIDMFRNARKLWQK